MPAPNCVAVFLISFYIYNADRSIYIPIILMFHVFTRSNHVLFEVAINLSSTSVTEELLLVYIHLLGIIVCVEFVILINKRVETSVIRSFQLNFYDSSIEKWCNIFIIVPLTTRNKKWRLMPYLFTL